LRKDPVHSREDGIGTREAQNINTLAKRIERYASNCVNVIGDRSAKLFGPDFFTYGCVEDHQEAIDCGSALRPLQVKSRADKSDKTVGGMDSSGTQTVGAEATWKRRERGGK
jgi:hypothetical protein